MFRFDDYLRSDGKDAFVSAVGIEEFLLGRHFTMKAGFTEHLFHQQVTKRISLDTSVLGFNFLRHHRERCLLAILKHYLAYRFFG